MISDGQARVWLEDQMDKAHDCVDRAFARLQVARAREAIMRNRFLRAEARLARARRKSEEGA